MLHWLSRLALGTLVVIVSMAVAGCASHTPPSTPAVTPVAADAEVDALIRHGCYRCLEQAYQRADSLGLRSQAFEAAALLTLRSKELGLPFANWYDRARMLVEPASPASVYLDIVDAIPPDRLVRNRDTLFDPTRRIRTRDSIAMWRDRLHDGPGSDVFRATLEVSLVCAFGTLQETADSFTGSVDPAAATPLFQYALGVCDATHQARLAALRADDTAFVEADFALGRYAFEAVTPNLEEALKRWESAAKAFPESPSITTRIGNGYRLWEDWMAALLAYEAALAVAPEHPEATIGRVISLSHLARSSEAIADATRLIDEGQWLLGDAYYWRAWNQLRLNNYQAARADADRARTLMSNSAIMVLSGVIEWRLGRLETAEKDFQDALTIDLGECEAAFDLGIVRNELRKLPEALAALKQAGQCYDLSIAVRREAIQKIRDGEGTDTLKARESARHERVLADFEERRQEVTRLVDALEKSAPSSATP